MHERQPITAENPKLTLVMDQKPPMGSRIYMVSEYGAGFIGEYHPELGVVAWCPLPKLSQEDRQRLMAV